MVEGSSRNFVQLVFLIWDFSTALSNWILQQLSGDTFKTLLNHIENETLTQPTANL